MGIVAGRPEAVRSGIDPLKCVVREGAGRGVCCKRQQSTALRPSAAGGLHDDLLTALQPVNQHLLLWAPMSVLLFNRTSLALFTV